LTDPTRHRPLVKARTPVASNSVLEVYFDHLVQPPDREVADFLVVQPKYQDIDGVTGVCVLPVVGDRFALVDCYRHPIGRMSLEAPKGFIEKDEAVARAAMRELAEETGLSCSAANLIHRGTVAPEPGIVGGRVTLFSALECSGKIRSDLSELGMSSVRLFTMAELSDEIRKERLQDAATLVLLTRHGAAAGRP